MKFLTILPLVSLVFERDYVEVENGDEHPGQVASSVEHARREATPNEQPTTAAAAATTRARSTRDAYVQAAAVAARRKESYVHTTASAVMHSIRSRVIPPLLPMQG